MYCSSCSTEFRDGFTRCSNCDVDLVAELPPAEGDADLGLVSIFATSDMTLVAILKLIFEDAGIQFNTRNEVLQDLIYGRMTGFNPVVGPIEFWVREEEEKAARELIEDILRRPFEPSGEPIEQSSTDVAEEASEVEAEGEGPATPTSSRPRRWRRVIGAVTLNICLLPIFYMSTGLILGETEWGERHLSSAMTTAFAIAFFFATVTCVAWVLRPKLAARLQALPLVPILWSLIAQRTHESEGTGSFDGLKEHALLIIATFFAAFGVVLIASAFLPRIIARIVRR
jgi:hypothetical protein